jgi:sensor histidine kinase YesM
MITGGSITFYAYNYQLHKQFAKRGLEQLAEDVARQVDAQMNLLDTLATDLATNKEFLDEVKKVYINEKDTIAQDKIKKILINNYINKYDVYRVTMFNDTGVLISTSSLNLSILEVKQKLKDSLWLKNYNILDGRKLIFLCDQDNWDQKNEEQLIALIKPIKLENKILGYLEITQKAELLYKVMLKKWDNEFVKTILLDGENKIFWTTKEKQIDQKSMESAIKTLNWYYSKTIEEENFIMAISNSQFNDWKTVLLIEKSDLHRSLKGIRRSIILAGIVLFGILSVFIWLSLKVITKPLEEMVKKLENFTLTPLTTFNESSEYHEIKVIQNALENMRMRLNYSLQKEKDLENMQIKVTFDLLQSQIGPHFLFNTLGSIANLCEEKENERAAQACYCLADLLRYSSNYKEMIVTLEEEMANVKDYFALMQERYRQRLNYLIEIEDNYKNIMLPRLTLQPLIENSIKYSLAQQESVEIKIIITRLNKAVIIVIEDDGPGLEKNTILEINNKYKEILSKGELSEVKENIKFGKMGLLGTLVRLNLYYGKNFKYKLDSNALSGTLIQLWILEEEENVYCNDCR